jgi:membrane fusion protein (multidrug efflux system)
VVNDLRVRPAQYVLPGESVASLLDENAHVSLIALLPGSSRPFLRPGKPLRVELDGFQYEYRELTIDYVSDQIVGPAEVRRYLGREISDALTLGGPQVLVRARLAAPTFTRGGETFNYVDGMTARAEARLRAESILVMLVPGLKGLWSDDTN